MTLRKLLFLLAFIFLTVIQAQRNKITLEVKLDDNTRILDIQQEILYHNTSNKDLNSIILHNWPNSFKNNKSPLNQRLLDDFKKDFHFAKSKDLGFTKIESININNTKVAFKESDIDILQLNLNTTLKPKDSIIINAHYKVKIPNASFTKFGKTKNGYHLRYWYLVPAVIQNGEWQTLNNLNLDDLFQNETKYEVTFDIQGNYDLVSNLTHKTDLNNSKHFLSGKNKKDIIINIEPKTKFKSFRTSSTEIKTDIYKSRISDTITQNLFQKEILFIEKTLGKFPHKELMIDANSVKKNSLKELYGLPHWLKAYPENFKYELELLQGLTIKFIEETFLINKRNDQWLSDALQTYLMIEYLNEYYPDLTLFGRYSKIWGFRKYNLSQIKQKDKYAIIHQLRARKLLNQALTIRADSLSNPNKKITNKFKAGLAFGYLQDFIGDSVFKQSIKSLYTNKDSNILSTSHFQNVIKAKTDKDLNWFFGDFINSEKNIDYKIKKVSKTKNQDSIQITIKNLNDIITPISLYGIENENIISKTWLTNIDSTKTVKLPYQKGVNRVGLNYEKKYPEFNSLDNFKKTSKSLFKKPLQLRFSKDFENPYYNQIFFEPAAKYNLYDGIVLSLNFNNKHFIEHNFRYSLSPGYAFKSQELTGRFSFDYDIYHKKSNLVYKTQHGFGGSSYNYDENLRYNSFSPYTIVNFRRKNLRKPAASYLIAKLNYIDREINLDLDHNLDINKEEDNYSVFNLSYAHVNSTIIKDSRFVVGTEISNDFSKLISKYRYIHFFSKRRSFDVRLYSGLFLNNNTKSNYFNFNLNRGSNYLFEHSLIGQSETTGLLSQQYISVDGGFKSFYEQNTISNSFISTANTSIGVWNWLEIYNNVGILKNKKEKGRFFYENGIRLNFVSDFFEIYLPVYNNEGWLINPSSDYSSKIRFTVTTKIKKIYNFFRRDFL